MHIGIDARFYGGGRAKGLGRYTEKLIECLQEIDHTNTYTIFFQKEDFDHVQFHNTHFHKVLADFPWYSFQEQRLMPRLLAQLHLDLVHFPHYNVPLFFRSRFVLTIHDLILHHFPTRKASTLGPVKYFFKQLGYRCVISQAAKHAQKILTVSNFSKQDIQQTFHTPSDKIVVTYEGADNVPMHHYNATQQKEMLTKLAVQQPYLLYVGNAYPHKNLGILLDVVQTLKAQGTINWQFVLVGKNDYFYLQLQEQARQFGLLDHVRFVGFVTDKELSVLYENALAYIFPSLYEGFGLPPLEAMLHGTPVLSSKASCLPEILKSYASYFDPQDKNDIIYAIQNIFSHPEHREKIKEEAQRYARHFSWQDMTRRTLEVYESCTKKYS
ncbi:MAG: hypothetical protein A3B74_04920 [Candidatus Kerfeldbacteria bacterium RIFCSPHIGHO2_02_FULL_42_14]|uniref:Glycosyl transferase family 1 n=1 Tax=Candidatus Kerfeldbacteria bacterium RIFCSPHIGHO2_02_FULL_42_14 TaxID=1798540 RepID=A0A1G2ARR9_9BACT|nr:MAG: hypothetical protein A3B74_04920 [Candidatus Kerfeldbacteria bacterium RIFCSPHIGHO2_02_FULL_42_14]OGY81063.1 MAG: hypothetical protein A3E60_03640 [Candidatus Kerfeldbacteria bacterium RIFCSPHIGHO2_12_FULL_42_13]OGY84881.1 MAG: hypothetical protein A3I91_05285 [Candidatus Kerfeldbacteria bacterium RIFCSPLOWO2_02_FULL_42_19]OGY86794.1 MAG: hypothetical protein A3G01_02585 [Candidatus Kerfeldbacteria bacterium RIFCSPLOWO2_12_FULL_43_9]